MNEGLTLSGNEVFDVVSDLLSARREPQDIIEWLVREGFGTEKARALVRAMTTR